MSSTKETRKKNSRLLRVITLSGLSILVAMPAYIITANAEPNTRNALHSWLENHQTLVSISNAVVYISAALICWFIMSGIDVLFDRKR